MGQLAQPRSRMVHASAPCISPQQAALRRIGGKDVTAVATMPVADYEEVQEFLGKLEADTSIPHGDVAQLTQELELDDVQVAELMAMLDERSVEVIDTPPN